MAVAGYAESQNRHALSCCVVLPKSQSGRNLLFKLVCTFCISFPMLLFHEVLRVFDLSVSVYVPPQSRHVVVVNVLRFVPVCGSVSCILCIMWQCILYVPPHAEV